MTATATDVRAPLIQCRFTLDHDHILATVHAMATLLLLENEHHRVLMRQLG